MKAIALLLFFLFNAGLLMAQQKPGTIRGAVHDVTTGEPIIYAKVLILDADSVAQGGAYTDFDGLFSVPHLSPGTYNVQVHEMQYDLGLANDVVLKPGSVETLKIQLKEKEKFHMEPIEIHLHRGGKVTRDTTVAKPPYKQE
jgi:hypothetical protein